MKRYFLLLALGIALALPGPVFALRSVIVGNQTLGPEFSPVPELLAAVNLPERVYLYNHNGNLTFFFKGAPKAVNEAMRRFAAIPAAKREIILLPVPAEPLNHDKKPIAYDWRLHVPIDRHFDGDSELADVRATLTIYVPECLPPALADAATARAWIADLGSDDFKTRERATKELTALGPPVGRLLREALAGRPSAEARSRIERIQAIVNAEIRLDTLELPAGVPVVGVEELLARCRKEMTNKDSTIRGHAARMLGDHVAAAEEVLPDLEKVLKTETLASPLAGAAWAAYHLGARARPLLPTLRATVKTVDKRVANICEQAIARIEKPPAEPIPAAEATKRATIRKEIRQIVAGMKGKAEGK